MALTRTGPALGVIPNVRFDVREVDLKPGQLRFAFTDGAPEAKDPQGEFFGRERVLRILQECDRSSRELVGTLEAKLRQYMGSTTQFDDITLLAVRRA